MTAPSDSSLRGILLRKAYEKRGVHAAEMERLYSKVEKVVTILAVTSTSTRPIRGLHRSRPLRLREKFGWAWERVPLSERVTLPANGRYPDAGFDGFLVSRSARAFLQGHFHPGSQ